MSTSSDRITGDEKTTPPTDRFSFLASSLKRAALSRDALSGTFAAIQQILGTGDWTAANLVEAYVYLRQIDAALQEGLKPLSDMLNMLNQTRIPETFESEKISSFTSTLGFRVTVAERLVASIPVENKDSAYEWLRKNGLGSLVIETVNASSLAAAAKHMIEEENKDLPDDLFKTTIIKQTSMTKVKSK